MTTETRVDRFGIAIVTDSDFVLDWDESLVAETQANLDDGTWGAYGVVVVTTCGHCGNTERDYSRALWGVVVESTTLADAGAVWDLVEIGDAYLREVAADLLAGVVPAN